MTTSKDITDKITPEMIEVALSAFNKCVNEPLMVACDRCDGKGFHHGFGEDGASPDWCLKCGGNAYDVVPGEEQRAMHAALVAAFPSLPSALADAERERDEANERCAAAVEDYNVQLAGHRLSAKQATENLLRATAAESTISSQAALLEEHRKLINDCLKECDRSQRPSYAWQLRARDLLSKLGASHDA